MGIQGRGNTVRDTARQDTGQDAKLIALSYWIWIAIIFAFVAIIILVPTAKACGHDCDYEKPKNNVYFAGDKDQAVAGVVIGAIVACGVVSAINRRWCWEPEPKPELPQPIGVPLKITPENISDRGWRNE